MGKGSGKMVNVECTVNAAVTATFELGEGETIEEFKAWFKKYVSATAELSEAENTETFAAEIVDMTCEVSRGG